MVRSPEKLERGEWRKEDRSTRNVNFKTLTNIKKFLCVRMSIFVFCGYLTVFKYQNGGTQFDIANE